MRSDDRHALITAHPSGRDGARLTHHDPVTGPSHSRPEPEHHLLSAPCPVRYSTDTVVANVVLSRMIPATRVRAIHRALADVRLAEKAHQLGIRRPSADAPWIEHIP